MCCRSDRRGGGGARGFTLIELMISIVLLGLIFSLLYASFFQVSSGTSRIREQVERQQHVRLLMQMIGDDLQAARFFEEFVEDEGGESGLFAEEEFVGTQRFTRLRFHSSLPARFYPQVPPERDPGMHEVAYWVEPAAEAEREEEKLVLMRREDFYLDDDMEEGGVEARLAEGVEAFRVEFLPVKRRQEEFEDDWLEEWSSSDQPKGQALPMAVRVTLTLAEEGEALTETLEINMATTFKVGP